MAAGGGQNQMDPEMAMLIVGGALALAVVVIYLTLAPALYWGVTAVRYPQLWLLDKVGVEPPQELQQQGITTNNLLGAAGCMLTRCPHMDAAIRGKMQEVVIEDDGQARLIRRDEKQATRAMLKETNGWIAQTVGQVTRWLFGGALVIMAAFVALFYSQVKFRHKYNLDSFRAFQAQAWKQIIPAAKSDPLQDSKGHWALAMTPREWVEKNKIDMIDIAPDREAVRNHLAAQLRRPWAGAKKLRHYERGLLAAFALKMDQRVAECKELLADMSEGWATHGSADKAIAKSPSLRGRIDRILEDKSLGLEILKHSRNHAFVESAFANMLQQARKRGGVLASAEFLWLKAEDRGLWYVLNGVGRPTYHIEGAGAIAHWKAEQTIGRPLPEPDVDEAVFGLEEWFARMVA